nr:retrovirus-related Pol polyprotein from transposon TNT 1-94 [Tanacetum cinerariifolium]
MEAIMFTNTSVHEIGIDNSSRYPLDEFIHEDDSSRQYQGNFNISYYVIPHGRSITELIQEKHILEVIALNEHGLPHTKDTKGPSDLINTKRVNEQNVQNEQIITQPTKGALGNNTEVLVSISESLVPDVSQGKSPSPRSHPLRPTPSQRRILSIPTQSPWELYVILKIKRETYNSLVWDFLPHSMRALINHSLFLRVQLLILKTQGETFSPLIRNYLSMVSKGMVKTTPLPKGLPGDKDLKGNKTPVDIEPINPTVISLSGISAKYQSDDKEVFAAGKDIDEDTQAAKEEHQSLPSNTDKPESSHTQDTDE